MPAPNYKVVQFRRGSTARNNQLIGAEGEITIDLEKKTVVVHDGIQMGGFPSQRESQPITRTRYLTMRAAITQQGVASLGFSAPENAPTAIPLMFGDIISGAAAFAKDQGQQIQDRVDLPETWVPPIGMELIWQTEAVTGVVWWRVEVLGAPIGSIVSGPHFETSIMVEGVAGTLPYQIINTVIPDISAQGTLEGAGKMFFRLTRLAGDTLNADAQLLAIRFPVRIHEL